MPEGLPGARAHRVGRVLLVRAHLREHGHHLPYDERERYEDRGDQHPGHREHDLHPERLHQRLEPAAPAEQQDQHEAGDDGRDGERHIDQPVDESLAFEIVAHQHPGHHHPEDRVNQGRGDRQYQRQL